MNKLSITILISHPRYSDKLPYTVEVWDDEADERDETKEKSFATIGEAEQYAVSLGATLPIKIGHE